LASSLSWLWGRKEVTRIHNKPKGKHCVAWLYERGRGGRKRRRRRRKKRRRGMKEGGRRGESREKEKDRMKPTVE
jgi:hypothetical protein